MTLTVAVVIASPMLSATCFLASSVLDHWPVVHIFGIALTASSGAWMAAR
jgi:hypothetical protein